MFEFMFQQVTHNKPQYCDKINCFKIMAVKDTISRWWDKSVSKNIETSLYIPMYNDWQGEIFF